jgi:hypothetical protein
MRDISIDGYFDELLIPPCLALVVGFIPEASIGKKQAPCSKD